MNVFNPLRMSKSSSVYLYEETVLIQKLDF